MVKAVLTRLLYRKLLVQMQHGMLALYWGIVFIQAGQKLGRFYELPTGNIFMKETLYLISTPTLGHINCPILVLMTRLEIQLALVNDIQSITYRLK